MYLPVSGVLDQLQALTQIDLEGNPTALRLGGIKAVAGEAERWDCNERTEVWDTCAVCQHRIEVPQNEILCPKL